MRINGFQCEQCKTMHSVPESYGNFSPPRHYLPESWFTAFRGTGENTEPLNFCSEGCLRTWAQGYGSVAQECPEDGRSLIFSLTRGCADDNTPEYPDEVLLARMGAVKWAFTKAFPDSASLNGNGRVFAAFDEQVYWLSGIGEEHVEWAKAAKASGLIDSYQVDYDPQGGEA